MYRVWLASNFKVRGIDSVTSQETVRTKLGVEEIIQRFDEKGIMAQKEFRKYVAPGLGEQKVTLSQLQRLTQKALHPESLGLEPQDHLQPKLGLQRSVLNVRREALPQYSSFTLESSPIRCTEMTERDRYLYLSRWKTKVLEEVLSKPKPTLQKRGVFSEKMALGNGNFLVWDADPN